MKIANAYLFGVDIWFVGKEAPRIYHESMNKADFRQKNLGIYWYKHFDQAEGVYGSSGLGRVDCQIPEYWKDKVKETFITHLSHDGDYITCKSLVVLNPDKAQQVILDAKSKPQITNYDDAEIDERSYLQFKDNTDDLLEKVFLPYDGLRSQGKRYNPRFASVFWIEPERALAKNIEDMFKNLSGIGKEVHSFLNRKDSASLPNILTGTLLVHGERTIQDLTEDSVVFNLLPINHKPYGNNKVVNSDVREVLEFIIATRICKHMVERLKNFPFYRESLMEYSGKLRHSKKLLDGYENVFMKDRECYSSARRDILQAVELINKRCEGNLIPIRKNYNLISPIETSSISPQIRVYAYNIIDKWYDVYQVALTSIRQMSDYIKTKEDALSEYLRDLTMAQATRANYALQKKVWRLSVIAVLIALLGFAQNFITLATIKKFVCDIYHNF
jgi:hypothetical protein